MSSPVIISAIGTPLDEREGLHKAGLELQLERQWSAGVDGILVAGTMGAMQMLRDQTYGELVEMASRRSQGRGEIFVGVGDASWSRTCDRIRLACEHPVDGVVVLTPYLFRFTRQQLIDYFVALADFSRLPVYLYDLPGLTGVELDVQVYAAIASHCNIRGVKVSGRLDVARALIAQYGEQLRVIVAEPDKVDVLVREGVVQHLDGMFAIAPEWSVRIARSAVIDSATAGAFQRKLNQLRQLLVSSPGIWGAITAIMNAQGVPGVFHCAPYAALSESQRADVVSQAVVRELCSMRAA